MWRESGTTLSFKDWLNRKKEQFSSYDGSEAPVIPNVPLTDSINKAIKDMRQVGGYKTEISKNKTFGIPNAVIIVAGVIIIGAIVYTQYKKQKV